jgi:GntR family transcriptional regulator/MocR family aminotransferase
MAHWGVHPVGVPVDDQGVRVDDLTATGLRVAVLTPAHQFPTGVVLSPARRRALLDWTAGGGLVVEDDYDAEHRYDRAPVAAFQASAGRRGWCSGMRRSPRIACARRPGGWPPRSSRSP